MKSCPSDAVSSVRTRFSRLKENVRSCGRVGSPGRGKRITEIRSERVAGVAAAALFATNPVRPLNSFPFSDVRPETFTNCVGRSAVGGSCVGGVSIGVFVSFYFLLTHTKFLPLVVLKIFQIYSKLSWAENF